MRQSREIEEMELPCLDGIAPFFNPKADKGYHWFKVNNYSELDTVCAYYGNERHGILPSAYPAVVCVEHPAYPLNRDKGERYASVHFIVLNGNAERLTYGELLTLEGILVSSICNCDSHIGELSVGNLSEEYNREQLEQWEKNKGDYQKILEKIRRMEQGTSLCAGSEE